MAEKVKVDLNKPTGNFWFDNGMVVLYDLFGGGEFDVEEVLKKLIEELVEETGKEGTYFDTQELKMKNYKRKNWIYPADKFIKSNAPAPKIVINKSGLQLSGNLKKSYYEIPQIKAFFEKLQMQGAIEIKGRKKIYIQFKNTQLLPPEFFRSLMEKPKSEKDYQIMLLPPGERNLNIGDFKERGICDVCGSTSGLTDAKMWMFPFTVEPGKFSNFYSGLKRGTKLCARCALSGLAGYLGWLWRAQGKDKLHIFIFHSDLETMYKLRKNVFKPLEYKEGSKGGNISFEFSGAYIHETTLGLLLRLFRELRTPEKVLSEDGRKLLEEILGEVPEEKPLTLFVFSGTPGKAFNMDSMVEFSEFRTLFRLYLRWLDLFSEVEGRPHEIVRNALAQFQKREGKNWNTIWREKISWAILDLKDPSAYIEDFLYEAKAKDDKPTPLYFRTLEIFELYWKEVIKMDERMLRVLSGFGHNLGKVANEKGEMGLLYALRNAKNPDEFYRVLNDIQFRLEIPIPEDILKIEKGEKINGSPWIRVKTLLSIYSMNSFLKEKSKA